MLDHLRTRENELFHENRELRDLVSVLSSRMLRFSRHLRQQRQHRSHGTHLRLDTEETSLDGESDAKDLLEYDDADASSDSSFEETTFGQTQITDNQRRQSEGVRHLLLEMPFHMVRDRLTCRVHRLSRRLWREIKSVEFSNENNRASPRNESSVRRHLEDELSRCKQKLVHSEQGLSEANDLLKTLRDSSSTDDKGDACVAKAKFTPSPRRIGRRR